MRVEKIEEPASPKGKSSGTPCKIITAKEIESFAQAYANGMHAGLNGKRMPVPAQPMPHGLGKPVSLAASPTQIPRTRSLAQVAQPASYMASLKSFVRTPQQQVFGGSGYLSRYSSGQCSVSSKTVVQTQSSSYASASPRVVVQPQTTPLYQSPRGDPRSPTTSYRTVTCSPPPAARSPRLISSGSQTLTTASWSTYGGALHPPRPAAASENSGSRASLPTSSQPAVSRQASSFVLPKFTMAKNPSGTSVAQPVPTSSVQRSISPVTLIQPGSPRLATRTSYITSPAPMSPRVIFRH